MVEANEIENETYFPLLQKSQVKVVSILVPFLQELPVVLHCFIDSLTLCNKSTKGTNNRPKQPIKRKSNKLATRKIDGVNINIQQIDFSAL